NLGLALRNLGKFDEAIHSYREAIRVNPKFAISHDHLAWLYAAGPDGVRDGKRAVELATRACALDEQWFGWKNPRFINTRAAVYAEVGQFDKAVESQRKALSFPAYEKAPGKDARQRLELYSQKKPSRDPALARRQPAPPPEAKRP